MSAEKDTYYDCSFVSIHYIICECGETFPSEDKLKSHLEIHHPHKRKRKEFKCGVCGETYKTEDACITHYEENHINEQDIKQEQPDEDSYETKPDISELLETKTEKDNYVYNGELNDQEVFNEEDVVMTEEIYDEEVVNEEIIDNDEIINTVEYIDAGDDSVLHLSDCAQLAEVQDGQLVFLVNNKGGKKATIITTSLDNDETSTEPQIQTITKVNMMDDEKKQKRKKNLKHRVCEMCGKKYVSNAALKYHQRVHTGERPYVCHLCPKAFTMALFLQIHIRTHTGERPYACSVCPKAFSNKAALLRHNRVHTGVKPYARPMCHKTFTQSNSMKLHVTTVHLKQPAPYKSKSRRLKAEENARKKHLCGPPQPTAKEAVRHVVKREVLSADDEQVYEIIESEEINDEQDKECYQIIYQ